MRASAQRPTGRWGKARTRTQAPGAHAGNLGRFRAQANRDPRSLTNTGHRTAQCYKQSVPTNAFADLTAAATHAALVLDRATDAVAWLNSGASPADAFAAATHNFPELTKTDRLAISLCIAQADLARGAA